MISSISYSSLVKQSFLSLFLCLSPFPLTFLLLSFPQLFFKHGRFSTSPIIPATDTIASLRIHFLRTYSSPQTGFSLFAPRPLLTGLLIWV
ncbi:hypothetical protein BDV29DRAFT_35253 [Aspergillus leporis]|uniref:Uncharacterized protein n=1 Tax=Aspergillus leporis TaxID=41062 RepID=A0A5N5WT71_9EURO|nr:hypothetical protein BDV29DRAFT_35253 [Aspergillus leporis]